MKGKRNFWNKKYGVKHKELMPKIENPCDVDYVLNLWCICKRVQRTITIQRSLQFKEYLAFSVHVSNSTLANATFSIRIGVENFNAFEIERPLWDSQQCTQIYSMTLMRGTDVTSLHSSLFCLSDYPSPTLPNLTLYSLRSYQIKTSTFVCLQRYVTSSIFQYIPRLFNRL